MAEDKKDAVAVAARNLPEPVTRRGIKEVQWLALCNTVFPGADPKSVLMVWDYCAARGLDPMKKPCHIVPMRVKDVRSGEWGWREVVMPGIYEFRTTAHRTGQYLGHDRPEYGESADVLGVSAPEWCDFTAYRLVGGQHRAPFPVRCYFREVVVTTTDKQSKVERVNDRWSRAPIQMLTKCAEAAALREAFPEELGGQHTDDELGGRRLEVNADVIDIPVNLLDRITSEAVRDAIEKAFALLNLPAGARLALINEHLGGDGVDADEGAVALLKACEAEHAKRQTPPVKPKGDSNGKPKRQDPPAGDPAGRNAGHPAPGVAGGEPAAPADAVAPGPAADSAGVSVPPPQAPLTAAEVGFDF